MGAVGTVVAGAVGTVMAGAVGTVMAGAAAGAGVAASIFAEADATGATAGPDTSARIDRGLSATIIAHDPNRKSGVSISPTRLICFLADRESTCAGG